MDLVVLLLCVVFFIISIIPVEKEEIDNKIYKLTHCDVHKWISKSTGFDGKEFESNYTVCEKCGYCPESGKYE